MGLVLGWWMSSTVTNSSRISRPSTHTSPRELSVQDTLKPNPNHNHSPSPSVGYDPSPNPCNAAVEGSTGRGSTARSATSGEGWS